MARPVFVGMAIAAFQQLTGINGVFLLELVVAAVGFTESMALAQTLLITAFRSSASCRASCWWTCVGRKRMLIYGGTPIFVSPASWRTVFTIAPTVDGEAGRRRLSSWHSWRSQRCARSCSDYPWAPSSIVMGARCSQPDLAAAPCRSHRADFPSSTSWSSSFPFLIG